MGIFNSINANLGKYIDVVGNTIDLRALTPRKLQDGDAVLVSSNITSNDRNGGIYVWSERSTATDDGLNTIRPGFVVGSGRWLLAVGKGNVGPASTVAGPQGPPGDGVGTITAPGGSALIGYKSTFANTVQRTVFAKLSERVSVKDFGAKGDGTTDDRTAIQTAIDTVSAAGGGTVFIPAGTYMMSVTGAQDGGICCLLLRSNVSLVGDNMFATTLKVMSNSFGNGAYFRAITTYGQITNIQLMDFGMDGNRFGQGLWARQGNGGNIVIDAVNCNIERVRSVEGNGQGIQVRGSANAPSSGLVIQNCRVNGMSGSTLFADGTIQYEFNGNGIGIQVSQAADYKILNNSINNCKDNGIDTYNENPGGQATGGQAIISGNVILNSRCGIFPETSARMIIHSNYISNMVEAGIAINRINSPPDYMSVSNNIIEYCTHGIRVSGNSGSLRIVENWIGFIVTAAGAGIYCENSSYVLIERNVFKIDYAVVPLTAFGGAQAVFNLITGNIYYNQPNPGLLSYFAGGTSTFGTTVDDWRAVSALSAPTNADGQFARNYGYIGTLTTSALTATGASALGATTTGALTSGDTKTGKFAANGATPQAKITLPANGTDLATTQALANAIKALLISYGLGA